jgi:hypothetical protein
MTVSGKELYVSKEQPPKNGTKIIAQNGIITRAIKSTRRHFPGTRECRHVMSVSTSEVGLRSSHHYPCHSMGSFTDLVIISRSLKRGSTSIGDLPHWRSWCLKVYHLKIPIDGCGRWMTSCENRSIIEIMASIRCKRPFRCSLPPSQP